MQLIIKPEKVKRNQLCPSKKWLSAYSGWPFFNFYSFLGDKFHRIPATSKDMLRP